MDLIQIEILVEILKNLNSEGMEYNTGKTSKDWWLGSPADIALDLDRTENDVGSQLRILREKGFIELGMHVQSGDGAYRLTKEGIDLVNKVL